MRLKSIFCLFTVAALGQLHAQSTAATSLVNAGTGYTLAVPSQAVAPGQLLVLSLLGIKAIFPKLLMGLVTDNGFPLSLGGITVDLIQDRPASVTPVELRGIQQEFCIRPEICNSVTGVTVQVPFALSSVPGNSPILRVSEGGQMVGTVLLRAVSDNIHVLNTCDGTLISISAAYSVPGDICAPVALDNFELNSLYNLAHSGDGVAAYAYGLGALANGNVDAPSQLIQTFQVSFDFRPNAAASRVGSGFGLTAAPAFVGYTGGGTYQINFAIPSIPDGLPACDGVAIKSNLTVTISGPNSFELSRFA